MLLDPSLTGCGWDVDGNVEWIEDTFPDDITTLFLGLEMDSESDNDSESEDSDSDDEHYREEESDGEEDYDGDNDDDDDLSYQMKNIFLLKLKSFFKLLFVWSKCCSVNQETETQNSPKPSNGHN